MTSLYGVRITDKFYLHPTKFTPTAVSFLIQTPKQDKTPSLSPVPILQVSQSVTNVDSNGTRIPAIITKIVIFTISGDPMYLIEGTHNQTYQAKIASLFVPSYSKLFFINSTIRPLCTNTDPNKSATTICFGSQCHTSLTKTVHPTSPIYQQLKQHFIPALTVCQAIAENTTADTPLLAKMSVTFPNFFPSYIT